MQHVTAEGLTAEELRDAWPALSAGERAEGFFLLPPAEADDFFLTLAPHDQAALLSSAPQRERRVWMRMLPPDDAADVLQEVHDDERALLLSLLDDATRREIYALLAFAEDAAGGLMSPRFARLRPDMSVDEAISYLRRQARDQVETIYYAYVLDRDQRLLGVVSFRELFAATGGRKVRDIMRTDVVTVAPDMDQEAVSRVIAERDLMAVPVVDDGRMIGIVTVDDIVDVVQEEATEDIHKLGGVGVLETSYLQTGFRAMLQKRAGWLAVLFAGEMLTATAMARFEHDISRAVVLVLFLPLIVSSGGNAGSQAATLVIRAMALDEVRLRDWWRILSRELGFGIAVGVILGALGLARILLWEAAFDSYGEQYLRIAATVSFSLVGVVLWGTLSGAMLPLLIRRAGLDPASASAPLVATLVDVFGLLIYFTIAKVVLVDPWF